MAAFYAARNDSIEEETPKMQKRNRNYKSKILALIRQEGLVSVLEGPEQQGWPGHCRREGGCRCLRDLEKVAALV